MKGKELKHKSARRFRRVNITKGKHKKLKTRIKRVIIKRMI
jgi:hypothetical protein